MVDFSGFDLCEAACFLHSSWPVVTQQGGSGQLIISLHFLVWVSSENPLKITISSVAETNLKSCVSSNILCILGVVHNTGSLFHVVLCINADSCFLNSETQKTFQNHKES